MSNKIILVGFAGSGKNTVGEYLVDRYGYTGLSFADALKDAVAAIFCWDRILLEGNTPEARIWRETVDVWWANRLGIPEFTPRWMLRNFGTEIMREHFNPNIWISNVERRLLDLGDKPWVVFDGRFPNEINLVTQTFGGESVWVRRGPKPDYWLTAQAANTGRHTAIIDLKERGIHPSEYAWIGTPIEREISNDGTIEDLHGAVDDWLSQAMVAS